MDRSLPVLVGIDVGATSIAGGLVTKQGEILAAVQSPTRERGSAVETLGAVVDDLMALARSDRVSPEGIGIGLPGLVDADKGMMINDFNLVPELAQVPLADHLRSSTGVAAFVDNDVNALALGEWCFGLGRYATSVVVLALGTGVGGGIIIGNTLIRGQTSCAGEFGHAPIDLEGPPCPCGGRGCPNVYMGGRQLETEARRRALEDHGGLLMSLAGGRAERITPKLVFDAAAARDPVAVCLVERVCRALGATIAVIVNTLNPEVVIVTGGLAVSLAPLAEEIRRHVTAYALAYAMTNTRIHITATDKRRTVRGAAALVTYELTRRLPTRAS